MSAAQRTFAALVHHPVYDRHHAVVTTAVTNLDIHDIARSVRSYGLGGYFLVTPIERQRDMIARILGHWQDGRGREVHPDRAEALARVAVVASVEEARERAGAGCQTTATAAQPRGETAAKIMGYDAWCAEVASTRAPQLLLFGTGWGLTDEVLRSADRILLPIQGKSDYNHLSVRSAVAVTLDRLFGDRAGDA